MQQHYQLTEETIAERFADTRDTLCYATNDNQTAVSGMLEVNADFAVVIGGYNSSNTSHLVELCEQKLPTYFIDSAERMISRYLLVDCNWKTKEQKEIHHFIPEKDPVKILITSGASCPDALVENVIKRLISFFPVNKTISAIKASFV
jgi:4-hydroxy-3-methylbut-2-enyl diphosphate reductase